MIVLYGKTASGKDTVLNSLVDDYGYKKIVTCTTRPKRSNEIDNKDYNFYSKKEFDELVDNCYFAEWKQYITSNGDIWEYGSSKESLLNADDKSVIILTPDGIEDILKLQEMDEKPTIIYIYANNSTIKQRLLLRGDDKAEAERRIEHDNEDFKGKEELADRIFYNNHGQDIDKLVKSIVNYIQTKN